MFYKLSAAVRRNRKWFIMLAGIIVFVTTYALILPAITIDKDTALDEPGMEVVLQESETAPDGETEPPDDSETTEPESTEPALPAVTLEESVGDVSVKVDADEGVFPADTSMILSTVDDKDAISSIENAVEDPVRQVQAMEVAFQNADGETVEPQDKFTLTVEPAKTDDDTSQVVVTLDEKGKAAIAESEKDEPVELLILPEEVPVVAVVETQELHTTLLTASGKTYEATVTFDQNAKIPEGSTLILTEFKEQSPAFQNAKQLVTDAGILNPEPAESTAEEETNGLLNSAAYQPMSIGGGLTGAKNSADSEAQPETGFDAFDLAIFDKNGNEIEPAAPVQVELTLKSLPNEITPAEFLDSVTVTHLRETGEGIQTEVVAQNGNGTPGTVEVEKDSAVMAFETDSFSVYTVTWTYRSSGRNYYRSSNIHYGYMNGSRFVEFPNGTPGNNVISINSSHSPAFLIYDVAGYQFDSAHLDSATGTEIEPLIRYNNSRWQYLQNGATPNDNNWHNIAYGNSTNENQDIYMVYKALDPVPNGGHAKLYETPTDDPDDPTVLKESENNHDGTRTLSLSVTGDTRPIEAEKLADVIVIYDVSGSMEKDLNGNTVSDSSQTRLAKGKQAIMGLADDLLNRKNREGGKLVRMALVTFSNAAQAIQMGSSGSYFTSDPSTYENAVDSITSGGGTNWEMALQIANRLDVDPERETFVIFVTDGNPTWRMTRSPTDEASTDEELLKTNTAERDMYNGSTYQYYRQYNVFGMGDSDNKGKNYAAALAESASIVEHGKHYYSIGISNDVTNLDRLMEECGAGEEHSFVTETEEALWDAIEKIRLSIEGTLGWGDVEVVDGITDLTNLIAKAPIVGVDPNSFSYYKSTDGGQTWTELDLEDEGINEATYDDSTGHVEWNMGEQFQLKKGVTYKVSFKVWPSQEATDIVTSLNNGTLSYNDLDAEIKAQIEDQGGYYTLKTNTEEAYVNYKVSRVTGTGVTTESEVFTIPFQSVPPLVVSTMPFSLNKEFADNLTEAEDRQTEVKLVLERRDKDDPNSAWEPVTLSYLIDKTTGEMSEPTTEIVLSNKNDWQTSFFISPGLIDAEGEHCNEGHEYRLRETELDYHYELDSEILHPYYRGFHTKAERDAYTHPQYPSENATELEGQQVYIKKIYEGDENGDKKVTATNIVKGGINISKVVMDHTGQHEIKPDETFIIRGKILDPDGNPYTFDPSWDDRTDVSTGEGASATWKAHQNDTGAYHIYNQAGQRIGYKMHFASTDQIELHLKGGEYVRFVNVPQNCTYEFWEADADMPDDYAFVRVDGHNVTKDETGNYIDYDADKQPTVNSDGSIEGSVYGDVQHNVEFTNKSTVEHYDIQLLKVDVGNTEKRLNGAQFELYKDEAHTQKATDINGNEVGTITTEGWLDEEQTQPAGIGHIGALPNGTYYLVETVAPNGYFELTDHIVITVSNGGLDVLQTDNAQGSAGEATHYEGQGLVTFTVTNTSGKELPHTGGPGTLLYTSGGLFLMAAAMIYLICVRRRERRFE